MPRAFSPSCAVVWGASLFLTAMSVADDAGKKPNTQAGNPISFTRDVAPLLVKHCVACHGAKKPEGEYQLHTFARLMKAGASGEPAIVAEKPEESYLVELLVSDDADLRMPKERKPLAAAEIEVLRRWITEGATFDGPDVAASLDSFIPKQPQPQPPAAYPRPVPVTALAFSPDGSFLATGGYHEVLLWNVFPGANNQEAPGSAGGSGDGSSTRASIPGQSPGLTESGPVATPTLVRRIRNVAQRTHAIAFNGDGSLMAVAAGTPGRMGEVKLFHPKSGELIADLATTTDEMFDVEFSRDGARLAACGADRTIRLFDIAERHEVRRIEVHADWVMAIAWSPDGTKLASAGRDKAAKVIDAATGVVLVTYPGHDEQVNDVVFSANGDHVYSAGRGRELHRWIASGDDSTKKDVRNKVTGAIIGRTRGEIFKLALLGDHVLAASADGNVSEFDPAKKDAREPAIIYGGAPPQAFSLALHAPQSASWPAGMTAA